MEKKMLADIEGIRARHVNADKVSPAQDPRYVNTAHDLACLLGVTDHLVSEISSYRVRMKEIRELAVKNRSSLTPSRADLERIAVIAEGQEALL